MTELNSSRIASLARTVRPKTFLTKTLASRGLLIAGLVVAVLALGRSESASAEIRWQSDVEQTLQSAQTSRKPILVFVGAKWCHFCEKMRKETWSDPALAEPVSQAFETLALDGDRDREIVESLGLQGFPATLVYSPEGKLLGRADGFMDTRRTAGWLRETLAR